jgi:hypothetical protein
MRFAARTPLDRKKSLKAAWSIIHFARDLSHSARQKKCHTRRSCVRCVLHNNKIAISNRVALTQRSPQSARLAPLVYYCLALHVRGAKRDFIKKMHSHEFDSLSVNTQEVLLVEKYIGLAGGMRPRAAHI